MIDNKQQLIVLPSQKDHIVKIMELDAKFCQSHNLIDYSVFLVIIDVGKDNNSPKKTQTMVFDAGTGKYETTELEAELIVESPTVFAPSRDK